MTRRKRLLAVVLVARRHAAARRAAAAAHRSDPGAVISFLVPTLATMAILSIICIGLNVQWGYTGIFNFGVVAFFMVGAYTAAIITKAPADGEFATYIGGFGEALAAVPLPGAGEWLPFLVAVLAAAALSAACVAPARRPIVRLREDYLAIALIGAAEVLRRIVTEEQWLVNGSRGMGGIPRPLERPGRRDRLQVISSCCSRAILLALVYVLADRGIRSPWGRVLRAIREDEAATAASGKDVVAFKLQGFVLGAAIMGAGGALFAFQQGAISPDTFTHFFGTFIIWAMLIAGGSGNMVGAIVGVFVIWGLWSTTLQLQGFDLPTFIEGRIPTCATRWWADHRRRAAAEPARSRPGAGSRLTLARPPGGGDAQERIVSSGISLTATACLRSPRAAMPLSHLRLTR